MKALFIKDLRYILQQKSFLILILGIALLLTWTQNDNYIFIIGYLSFMGLITSMTSISIDDQNRNLAFLFTLPITRKGYVREKYLFSIIMGLIFGGIATALCLLFRGFSDYKAPVNEILLTGVGTLGAMLIFISIMLPFTLKFGAERARIASMISIGLFMALILLLSLVINFSDALPLIQRIATQPPTLLATIACIIILLCLALSYRISQRILHKREF